MNFQRSPPRSDIQGQATYGMANLRQGTTGLPFIVFISQKDAARHSARVKVSPAPKIRKDAMSSYSIDPFKRREGPALSKDEEDMLARWISINKAPLLAYWDGEIEYTEDVLSKLQAI